MLDVVIAKQKTLPPNSTAEVVTAFGRIYPRPSLDAASRSHGYDLSGVARISESSMAPETDKPGVSAGITFARVHPHCALDAATGGHGDGLSEVASTIMIKSADAAETPDEDDLTERVGLLSLGVRNRK